MRVGVLLSGGIDSAAAARALLSQGHGVIAYHLLLHEHSDPAPAQRMAKHLGIPLQVLDLRREFERLVIKRVVEAYSKGWALNPCVVCNREIKFGLAAKEILSFCDAVATGHYARLSVREGEVFLEEGADPVKSQAYFLALVKAEVLKKALFPLGELTKEEVRRRNPDLPALPESYDVCFAPAGLSRFLEERLGRERGPIFYRGRLVGFHRGAHRLTVGQRRGLGVGLGRRLYVVRLEPPEVHVDTWEAAHRREIEVGSVNWLAEPVGEAVVRVRVSHRGTPARLVPTGEDKLRVVFEEPVFAPAPGQLAAFYRGRRVLGGGIILR